MAFQIWRLPCDALDGLIDPCIRLVYLEVVPETVAHDEGVGFLGRVRNAEMLDKVPHIRVLNRVLEQRVVFKPAAALARTAHRIRVVVPDDACRDGGVVGAFAGFERLGAFAVGAQVVGEVEPSGASAHDKVFSEENAYGNGNVPHHAVTQDEDLLKAGQDIADLVRIEPSHVAAARAEGGVEADASARAHGFEEGVLGLAQGLKGAVQFETVDCAVECLREIFEGVDCIGEATDGKLSEGEGAWDRGRLDRRHGNGFGDGCEGFVRGWSALLMGFC